MMRPSTADPTAVPPGTAFRTKPISDAIATKPGRPVAAAVCRHLGGRRRVSAEGRRHVPGNRAIRKTRQIGAGIRSARRVARTRQGARLGDGPWRDGRVGPVGRTSLPAPRRPPGRIPPSPPSSASGRGLRPGPRAGRGEKPAPLVAMGVGARAVRGASESSEPIAACPWTSSRGRRVPAGVISSA